MQTIPDDFETGGETPYREHYRWTDLRRLLRMRGNSSTFTIHGSGFRRERGIWGVYWFSRQNIQKWTDVYFEVRQDYGIRIGSLQIAVSKSYKRWRDGKTPWLEPCKDPH